MSIGASPYCPPSQGRPSKMSATRIIELVEEHKGVPASDGAFDRKLLLAAQDLHAWQFASSLEQIVRRYPTPRGWAIAGYALANAGLLKQAIACLKKGRQSNTSHEMIASCWFVLDEAGKGIRASKKSPDSRLHEAQGGAKPQRGLSVNSLAWAFALVYILERPPVFGEGPSPGFFGQLALINMALQTLTAWQGASSGHPVLAVQFESYVESWRNLGVDVASDPLALVRFLSQSQLEFWSAAKRTSVTRVLQELCSTGSF